MSIAGNNLRTLQGLSERLNYLNASANKFTTLEGLEVAISLRILILANSMVRDLSSLLFLKQLLYLDMSSSNLPETATESLANCACLQYLDASNNFFRSMPEITNSMLYELRLGGNMLSHISRMPWLFYLRILHLPNNQIIDLVPLGMCPYLRELDISNNVIRGPDC